MSLFMCVGVVAKIGVLSPSVGNANTDTEQRYFIAYLHRYGCLSQNSTPQASKLTVIYTQSINILNFLIHMHCYSIKLLVKVSLSRM